MKQACLVFLVLLSVLHGCSHEGPSAAWRGATDAGASTPPGDRSGGPKDAKGERHATKANQDVSEDVKAPDDEESEPVAMQDGSGEGGAAVAALQDPAERDAATAEVSSDSADSDPDGVVSDDAGPGSSTDASETTRGDDDDGPESASGLTPPPPEPEPQAEPGTCPPGSWDDDGDAQTACVPFTDCVPGQYVIAPPSQFSDRRCAECVPGTFSTNPNAARCVSFTSCNPGQSEVSPGTGVADRVCSGQTEFDCAAGSWDDDGSPMTPCAPHTVCAAGEFVLSEGTATSDRECAVCTSGAFSNRDNAASCKPLTSCAPGQFVLVEGSASRDRSCANCASGHWSSEENAVSCTRWTSCEAGTFVSLPEPSATADRSCQPCAAGTTTTGANQGTCLLESECQAGTERVETSAGPACEDCDPGTYCAGGAAPLVDCDEASYDDLDASTSCIPKSTCAPGYHVADPGDPVTDRSCAPCPGGTFSTSSNADVCTPFSGCSGSQILLEAGTSTADDVCSQLEILQIVAGGRHTCIRLSDGGVRCWGEGGSGQLGTGTDEDLNAPPSENIGGLGFVTDIAAGTAHTCAVQASGTVRCWGRGTEGQLGYDEPSANRLSPGADLRWKDTGTEMMPFTHAVEVVAGTEHTCARLANGQISCWGSNAFGQLGYENAGALYIPGSAVPFPGESNAPVELVAGWAHTCARFDDGRVRCWGFSGSGETGYGEIAPVRTAGGDLDFAGARVERLAGNSGAHTCAVLDDGNLRCWGWGLNGRTGYGDTTNVPSNDKPLPMAANVPLGGLVAALAVGDGHSCAALRGGGVRCWGQGNAGQLGYGEPLIDVADGLGNSIIEAGDVNVRLRDDATVVQIATGGDGNGGHTCVLASDGSVYCWGQGTEGQLGYGDNRSLSTPGPRLTF